VAPAGAGANGASSLVVELAFWDAIKNSTQSTDYEAYLTQYPQGRFAVLARARVRSLGGEAPARLVPPAPTVAASVPATVAAAPAPSIPAPATPAPAITAPATPATAISAPAISAPAVALRPAIPAVAVAAAAVAPAPAGAAGNDADPSNPTRFVYTVEDIQWRRSTGVTLQVSGRRADRTEFNGGRRVESPSGRLIDRADGSSSLGLLDVYQPPQGWVPDGLAAGGASGSPRFSLAPYNPSPNCTITLDGELLPEATGGGGRADGHAPIEGRVVRVRYGGKINCLADIGGSQNVQQRYEWPLQVEVRYSVGLKRIVHAVIEGRGISQPTLRFMERLALTQVE